MSPITDGKTYIKAEAELSELRVLQEIVEEEMNAKLERITADIRALEEEIERYEQEQRALDD